MRGVIHGWEFLQPGHTNMNRASESIYVPSSMEEKSMARFRSAIRHASTRGQWHRDQAAGSKGEKSSGRPIEAGRHLNEFEEAGLRAVNSDHERSKHAETAWM
jgi:hypothetical protein